MYLDYTEKELLKKFMNMGTKEIIDFLLDEGLSLKTYDLSDLPRGIYRRKEGTDLVRFDGFEAFNYVDQYGYQEEVAIEWACFDYTDNQGDWWVLVLDEQNYPISSFDTVEFRMNSKGERTG